MLMRRTNWLLLVGAGLLSAWVVCWTGVFVYSLGASAGRYQGLGEVMKSLFAGADLVVVTFLMYVPLWLGIIFVWMGALWQEEPPRPKHRSIHCKYCGARISTDSKFCGQCGRELEKELF